MTLEFTVLNGFLQKFRYNPAKGVCSGNNQRLSLVQALETGAWYNWGGLSAHFDVPKGRKNKNAGEQDYPDYQGQNSGPGTMRDAPAYSTVTATVCAKCTTCINGATTEEILGCVNFTWDCTKPTWKGPDKTTVLTTGQKKKGIPSCSPGKVWEKAKTKWNRIKN